jgi:hypothetical protein
MHSEAEYIKRVEGEQDREIAIEMVFYVWVYLYYTIQ